MACTASCASLRALGVDEHALNATMNAISASRFRMDIVLLLTVVECVLRDYQRRRSTKKGRFVALLRHGAPVGTVSKVKTVVALAVVVNKIYGNNPRFSGRAPVPIQRNQRLAWILAGPAMQ